MMRRRILTGEQGLTLIELLIVILVGSIITGALFSILDVTLSQTSRTFTKVDATQRARPALETIEQELHSSCLGSGVTPILVASSPTNLIFISQFGNAPSPTPVEHQITFSAAAGTLVDSSFAMTGGTSPNWTFAINASSTVTLLTNVAQSGSVPVFQYFAYQEPMNGASPYTDGAGNPYMMLLDGTSSVPGTTTIPAAQPLATPLSAANAQMAAEVLINFVVGPAGGTGENTTLGDVNNSVTDSVVLRVTPPPNHVGTGLTFNPCQ